MAEFWKVGTVGCKIDQLIDITHFVSKIAWICLVIACRIVLLFTKIYIKIYINCSVPAVNFYWRENKIFGHKIRNCEKRSKKIKNKHVIVLKIENLYMQSKHQHAVLKLIQLQARRKVWKSGGAGSTVVGIICPPGWDRVN